MGFFDIFRKPTKKEVTHERMRRIRERGKEGERYSEWDNSLSKYERVHHGADYVKTVRDSAGRERKEPHEIKRNNSPLSKLQKKTHGLKVDRYIDTPYGVVKKTFNRSGDEIKKDPITGKWNRVKKHNSGFSSLWGTGSSSKPKKSRSSSYDSLWGTGPSSKPKKSRSSSYDSLWGTGPSSKPKKSRSSSYDSLWGTGPSSKPKKSRSSSYDSLWGTGSSSKSKSKRKSDSIW